MVAKMDTYVITFWPMEEDKIDFQIQQSHFMYKITTKQQPSPKNVIAQRNDPDMFHQNSSWITEEK